MTTPQTPVFMELDLDAIASMTGDVVVVLSEDGRMDTGARRVNRLSKGALKRLAESEDFEKAAVGDVFKLAFPASMAADSILVLKLPRRVEKALARKAGAAAAKDAGNNALHILIGTLRDGLDIVMGAALRRYRFDVRKSEQADPFGALMVYAKDSSTLGQDYASKAAAVEGVFLTRDLVNEPANVLGTEEFADRLSSLTDLGVTVRVMEEDALVELGMGAFVGVGLGSETPTKMVVMEWMGGGEEAPFALVGKGVVFDTGGISLKPASGMEDMTMDMGGAGTVAGVMKTLALRKARANVVGLVGLVENMPDGKAQRPGDIVTSMKGDTIEVINTDAEGRLVLCDMLWYAQETYAPVGMINLATLTGAIIIGLGHENAGVFSNSDTLSRNFLKACAAEAEGAWRMPMGDAYDKLLKSEKADMKNVGGRPAGSITAAQFLGRFVKEDCPWIHLDIAGVASVATGTDLAPKGATGWGVRALDRLIADTYEAE